MRGFHYTPGFLGQRFLLALLAFVSLGAALFSTGCAGMGQVTPPGGGGPLTISNTAASNSTVTSVAIAWQTSAPASSQVEYGTTTSYGSMTVLDMTMVASHQVTVSSLKPGTTYHYRVHSTDANSQSAVSGDLTFATAADTTPPTVSITAPTANATLSGTISVTASASDDVAVASVQFKVDSANTGSAITAAPYTYALDTTKLSDGNHVLTAAATDTSGNAATSAGVTVKVNNAAPAPAIASLNPTSGVASTAVTITGANFGAAQGTSTVTFSGVAATATNWSATSIATTVPAGATTGNVVVTVGGVASNGANFTVTVPVPSITSLNPTSGVIGTAVTITGANFGAAQGTSTVKFNGMTAAVTSWSASSIATSVPAGATTGNVVVTVGGVASNGVSFTVTLPAPNITNLNPTSGVVGTTVTITGANFGATQGTSTATFNGIAATATSWSATSIVTSVPAGATTGNVVVTVGGVTSNGVTFTVTVPAPSITSLNPASGVVGTAVTITGANFGATQGTSTVTFSGTPATATSWSATSIVTSVPAGAAAGNVVVTVGGVASMGVSFTVTADTSPPVVTITAPANNATVSGTITLTATATDPDSAVSFVQFQIDGANSGAQLTSAPYSLSLDTTTVTNGTHTLTAVAQDPTGNKGTSAAVSITVSNSTSSSMGPLKQSTVNTRYFVAPSGKAVFLSGSHTWNNFQDTDTNVSSTPAAMDFNAFVNMLKQDGHNATILWHKDLPEYCGWNFSGSVWRMDPWPWLRPGPGLATDGGAKFDLTQFNQPYFDRLRARVQQLQQNGIYATIELFDANQLTSARCSTDGYPYSGPNNINGVSDGYSSGASGTSSYTMTTNNAITNFQDAYVKKVVDTLNDLPNVIWEVAEEQPAASMTWWAPHVMGLLRAYEGGGTFEGTTYTAKPFQHTVGIGSLNATAPNDATLYGSAADWIAPTVNTSFSNQFPSNVSTNNQGKVVINDSDHALGYKSFLNSSGTVQDQNLRGYLWENLTNGAEGVIFMDPYEIFWQGSPVRNTCLNPANQVCTGGPDAKYNNFRLAMGYLQNFANTNLNVLKMTPQNSLSSTGHCLADNSATGAEYVVYAPSGGTFTVNLTVTTRALNVQWLNPATGAVTTGAGITGGTTQSFTPPFSGDAVLYIVDAAGHN